MVNFPTCSLQTFPIKKSFIALCAKRNPKLNRHMLDCVFLSFNTCIVFENYIASQEEQISKLKSVVTNILYVSSWAQGFLTCG